MAANPKPLRKLEKEFTRTRYGGSKRLFEMSKKRFHRTMLPLLKVTPLRHSILVKRKIVPAKFFIWALWFETKRRQIKNTILPGGVRVSTVFLGLDGLPPFETMVFGGDRDQDQRRATTYEEALAVHQQMIEKTFEVV